MLRVIDGFAPSVDRAVLLDDRSFAQTDLRWRPTEQW